MRWRRSHEPACVVSALLLVPAIACSSSQPSREGGLSPAGGDTGTGATGGATAAGGTSGRHSGGSLGIGGDLPVNPCGNGRLDEAEECDDSNLVGGDGCAATCQVEVDVSCPSVGACTSNVVCGNGIVNVSREGCDDGNTASGDGCSSTCALEPGWSCPGAGLACRPRCGDTVVLAGEQCDDGNTVSGDGCSSACRIEHPRCLPGTSTKTGTGGAGGESGSSASGAADVEACADPVCGDATVDAPEECDDGLMRNQSVYGGCTPDCHYAPFCGDGIVELHTEQCDGWTDMATADDPRCTACRFSPYCGDGQIQPELGEECDDGSSNGRGRCEPDCRLNYR